MLKRSILFFAFVLKQALSAHWLEHSGWGAGWDGWSEVAGEGGASTGSKTAESLCCIEAAKQIHPFEVTELM